MGVDIFGDAHGAGQLAANSLMPTPTAGAATSLYQGQAGMKLAMAGEGLAGLDAFGVGLYQGRVADQNAKILEGNAQQAQLAGQNEESLYRLREGQARGQRKADLAAGNVDVASPVAGDIERSSNLIENLDAASIRYNAEREAYNNRIQAMSERTQAGFAREAGASALGRSLFKIDSTYIGGASSLATKWDAMRNAGIR